MNHLHEWIEYYSSMAGAPAYNLDAAKSSICFAMPQMSECPRMEQREELMRLPYERVWLEGRGKCAEQSTSDDGIVGFYGVQKPDGFVAIAFTGVNIAGRGRCWFNYAGFGWSAADGWTQTADAPPTPKLTKEYTDWLGSFLTLLNCANVSRSEHHPGEQLQKARVRRGKLPLYSYWTLDLNLGGSQPGESQGGTHASPRLHLRRGHTRQYQPGKWCWINPCAVGNKKLGVVHKDYAVHHKAAP